MKKLNFACALIAPWVISAAAYGSPFHPSESLKIKDILYNGSGCPLGSVAENVSDQEDAFTLTFSEFSAEVYQGSRPSQQTKNCMLTLVLDVPAGWQFSVADFYYRGYMDLDAWVDASHQTSYYFQGQGKQGSFKSLQQGRYNGFEGPFNYHDKIGLETAVWSICNVQRALNINTRIGVTNTQKMSRPSAQGYIANDSIDGQIVQKFGITWRRCS